MRTPRVCRLAPAPVIVALMACGEGGPAATSGQLGIVDIRSESAWVAIPVAGLEPVAPLCAPGTESCRAGPQAHAKVDSAGDVLFLALTGRRTQVMRLRAGSDAPIALGRDGGGPGEYRIPAVIGLASNGDAVVYDLMARRVVRFAADGRPVATSLAPLPSAPLPAFDAVGGELRMLGTAVPSSPGDSMPVLMFALDSGTTDARRLHELALRQPAFRIDAMRPVPPVFEAQPLFALHEDGRVAFTDAAELVIDLFDAAGRHERRFGFASVRRDVSEAEVAAAGARRTRGVSDPRMRSAIEAQTATGAARHPAITKLVALNNGELWVRETPRAEGDSVSWIAFSAAGEALRRVWTGADDAILAWRGDRLLVHRTRDDEDADSSGYWWFAVR